MTKKTWITGAVVLVLGASVVGWAAPPRGGRSREGLVERLGLSSEQVEQLHKQRSERQKEAVQRRADMQKLNIELRELLAASALDETAVRAKGRQLAELQAAGARERVETRLALRKLLTPEQVEKLRALGLQRGARQQRRGPRQWRGRPGGVGASRGGDPGDAGDAPEGWDEPGER